MHVGMDLFQENDFSVSLPQEEFTEGAKAISTSPELWAARQRQQSSDQIKLRQCKLGEPCRWATASRPNIASRTNHLQGSDVYRTNDLVETVKGWRQATVSMYAASPHPRTPECGDFGRQYVLAEKKYSAAQCIIIYPTLYSIE